MQWFKLTKCGLLFNIVSPAVHTFLPSVLQGLDSRGTEALTQIFEKFLNSRYNCIIGPILLPSQVFFFHVGEQKIVRWCQIRRIWRVVYQFKAAVTHSSHAATYLCAWALSWWNRTPFVSFLGRLPNVSSTTFQCPELPIQGGFIWKETMQLVSGKIECNARQISLLRHNSFLVSLWTFQPTLLLELIWFLYSPNINLATYTYCLKILNGWH